MVVRWGGEKQIKEYLAPTKVQVLKEECRNSACSNSKFDCTVQKAQKVYKRSIEDLCYR